MKTTDSAIHVISNINLLIFRYVFLLIQIPGNNHVTEGIIFQMPWWDLKAALQKGRFWSFS